MNLALLFYLGTTLYAVSCERIKEIVPMISLKTVPQGPDYFAGYFNYRGEIVPVIDLCRLIHGHPCRMRLSTRIILVDYTDFNNGPCLVGLIAERVTETIRNPSFTAAPLRMEQAPYLGNIMIENNRMIRHIDLERLPSGVGFMPILAGSDHDAA